jgi:tetratricopeptide (TPR) repeat protein
VALPQATAGYNGGVAVSAEGSLLAGRYRVLRRLGAGGMATVLLCRDERLDREVAVKRLHADSPEEMERRFAREARVGASLNHPGLVTVYDTATDDEGVLIVMEYVEGETLSDAIRRGPLGPPAVGRLAAELGEALAHVHAEGVVHRDVKPANVLLRRDGSVKLADLGIATAADQTRITHSGIVLGTASYMAPEQLDGRDAGAPADVYALAAVCFEALTGTRPRSGRTPVELAHAIANEPPPDLRDRMPDAPRAAAEVLREALAREPADRPTAALLGRRLRRALEEAPEPTAATRAIRPVAPPPPAQRPPARAPRPAPAPRRRGDRPWVALAVLSALVLVAAAAIALVASSGDDPAPERDAARPQATSEERAQQPATPSPEEPTEDEPAAETPAPEPEAEPDPAGGPELNADGFALMQQGRYAEAVPILQRAVASWPEDSRDLEYAYALFNLGKSLLETGDAAAAIPYLEKRLTFDDGQRGTVMRELRRAEREAGG